MSSFLICRLRTQLASKMFIALKSWADVKLSHELVDVKLFFLKIYWPLKIGNTILANNNRTVSARSKVSVPKQPSVLVASTVSFYFPVTLYFLSHILLLTFKIPDRPKIHMWATLIIRSNILMLWFGIFLLYIVIKFIFCKGRCYVDKKIQRLCNT